MSKGRATPAKRRAAASGAERPCNHPDCIGEGLYRAPRSRHELDEHIWLCLDHIREYNRAWDYFAGMSTDEIEAHTRRDMIGWRPTWPLGRLGSAHAEAKREEAARRSSWRRGNGRSQGRGPSDDPFDNMRDPFEFFAEGGEAAGARPGRDRGTGRNGERTAGRNGARNEEMEALHTMGLRLPLTKTALRTRYKELVKRLHPDANGGDKAAEERLKLVNQAYATLKNSVSAP